MKYWIWSHWHYRVCMALRFRTLKERDRLGYKKIVRRTNPILLFLGRAQMPICSKLDDWANGYRSEA